MISSVKKLNDEWLSLSLEQEQKTNIDTQILSISLQKLSLAFNTFIEATLDKNNKPKAPKQGDIAKARGYLPPYCVLAYRKRER